MTISPIGISPTDLIAAASDVLKTGGYKRISQFPEWDTPTSRLFEDEYNIVGIVVFDSCGELLRTWTDLQGSLVEVISRHIGLSESKSWDGYLVLMTSGQPLLDSAEFEAVKYNTRRLRKLIATGDELRSLIDVERVLRPLLPFSSEGANLSQGSALDLLPRLLAEQGIDEEITKALVDAFREQSPLLERLHKQRGEQ